MSWHKILGTVLLIFLFGLLLRPGTITGSAQAMGAPAPAQATPPAQGMPVVVKSGGAALHDSPNGAATRRLETGAVVQAISRTPTGDWIFVEVEPGVQGWLANAALVSVNPASLPVYGRPQAEGSARQIGQNQPAPAAPVTATPAQEPSPTAEPTATPTATPTPTPTTAPTSTPTPTATATPIPPALPAEPAPRQAAGADPFLRTVGVVRAGGAALAAQPGGGESSGSAGPGEVVTLLRRSRDDLWLEVSRADGTTGWAAAADLIRAGLARIPRLGDEENPALAAAPVVDSPAAEPTAAGEDRTRLATVRTDGSRLNVRSGPGAAYPVVAKAENGSSYPVLAEEADGGWVQIEVPDAAEGQGWVSARFVSLSGPFE